MTSSDEQPKIPERWRQFYAEVCRAAKFFRNTDPSPAKSLIEELGTAEARVAELEAQVDAIREDNAQSYAEMKRRYEARLVALQRISDWCEAYPLDVFTEPDMEQVRRLLGDTLLTQLSAHNFRHVLDGIKGIIAPQSGGK